MSEDLREIIPLNCQSSDGLGAKIRSHGYYEWYRVPPPIEEYSQAWNGPMNGYGSKNT